MNDKASGVRCRVRVFRGAAYVNNRNLKGEPNATAFTDTQLKNLIRTAIFYARMGGVQDAITNHDWRFEFTDDEVIARTLNEDLSHVAKVTKK